MFQNLILLENKNNTINKDFFLLSSVCIKNMFFYQEDSCGYYRYYGKIFNNNLDYYITNNIKIKKFNQKLKEFEIIKIKEYFNNLEFTVNYKDINFNNKYGIIHKTESEFIIKEPTIQVLWGLVFKKEYLQYIGWCLFSQEDIDTRCLEFWYDKDILSKNFKSNTLKKLLKEKLNTFKDMDISIVEKENPTLDLYTNIEKPKVKSIKEYKEHLEKIYSDSIF